MLRLLPIVRRIHNFAPIDERRPYYIRPPYSLSIPIQNLKENFPAKQVCIVHADTVVDMQTRDKLTIKTPMSLIVVYTHLAKYVLKNLTLKVVSESCVTWATFVPILVFLSLSVLELGPMYATDRQTDRRQRQTDVRQHHRLMPRVLGAWA